MPRSRRCRHAVSCGHGAKRGFVAAVAAGLVCIACLGTLPGDALADTSTRLGGWRYALSVASFRLPEADLDAGGKTDLTTYHLHAGARRRIASGVSLGLALNYGHYDRGFAGEEGFGGLRPWGDTHYLALSTSMRVRPNARWTYGIRPFATAFSESGDIDSDTLSYGLAFAAVKRWSSRQHLGLGARVTRRIDDSTKVVPFVVVRWRFNKRWLLTNPSEPDLIGARGLEIVYKPDDRWRFALLGVYDSPEFRLDDKGVAPGGIGEHKGIMALIRADRRWRSGVVLKGYLGVLLDGSLEVRDADGRTIASSDYDATPMAGIALEKSF